MPRRIGKRIRKQARKFRAHLRPVIEATNREINELCSAFNWTENLVVRRELTRE